MKPNELTANGLGNLRALEEFRIHSMGPEGNHGVVDLVDAVVATREALVKVMEHLESKEIEQVCQIAALHGFVLSEAFSACGAEILREAREVLPPEQSP